MRSALDKVYLGLEFKNAKGTDGNWSVIMANMKANTPASTAPKEKQRAVLIHELVLPISIPMWFIRMVTEKLNTYRRLTVLS